LAAFQAYDRLYDSFTVCGNRRRRTQPPGDTVSDHLENQRADFYRSSPEAIKAIIALDASVAKLGLDAGLLDLVKLRASQINGCAYCVDMHAADARKKGDTERRVNAIAVWRETPFFSARERAALAWTEAVTLIATSRACDADYETLCGEFDEKERVDLTVAIATINTWNRVAVSFRKMPTL
jgi:AhpD family alkylhydroperoxidase